MSKAFSLSCPGKVFFSGEYACLDGGPALLGTCGPRFTLELSAGTVPSPFHPQSPAGLFLAKNQDLFRGYSISWQDPYTTPIGVGSSSAQFLLMLGAACMLRGKNLPQGAALLEEYWSVVDYSKTLRPSGVDVLAQRTGGPVVVRSGSSADPDVRTRKLPRTEWDRFRLLLVFTGQKVKTHEVLGNLREHGFPGKYRGTLRELDAITENAVKAWESTDATTFGWALNAYQETLFDGGLAHAEFTMMLRDVRSWPGVLGCKGAGAQGGDCFLLFINNEAIVDVNNRLEGRGWQPYPVLWTHQGVG